jgi:hypothetical protein
LRITKVGKHKQEGGDSHVKCQMYNCREDSEYKVQRVTPMYICERHKELINLKTKSAP